jgi:hypothetical protein
VDLLIGQALVELTELMADYTDIADYTEVTLTLTLTEVMVLWDAELILSDVDFTEVLWDVDFMEVLWDADILAFTVVMVPLDVE